MNFRKIVFDALLKQEEGSYSNLTLNSIIKNTTEDVSFITHLFYGVIERKITLDYIIDK